jgi:hypothetical protein
MTAVKREFKLSFKILTEEYISTKLGWCSPPQDTQVSGSSPTFPLTAKPFL